MDQQFPSWQEIARLVKDRKVVFFGAGTYAAKTKRKIDYDCLFVADNNGNLWGKKDDTGLMIKDPQELKPHASKEDVLIIITSTSFGDITQQLESYGFKAGTDIIVTPILNDLRIIGQMESVKTKMLFSSGFPAHEDPRYGGGIYELTVDGYEWDYRKVHSGPCHGLFKFGDTIMAVDQVTGLIQFDLEYTVIKSGKTPEASRCHGIDYSDITDKFYVAASHLDQVLVFNRDLKLEDSIAISHKYERYGVAKHHCNDICVFGHSAYVSMFSATGNFSESDIYDGAVLEIDIPTKRVVGPVIQNLWMPHNIMQLGGNMVVLDSLPGYLRKNNAQVVGQFPGFTRGLDYDGALFYIGQSRNRNYSKYLGLSNNISIDAGIIIFDEITKVSRTLQLPPQLSEIHSILLLDN